MNEGPPGEKEEETPATEGPLDPLAGGTVEVPDTPLGVPADADADEKDQPGIPDGEPPAAD